LGLGESRERLAEIAVERLGVPRTSVRRWQILRRSLDARGRRKPRYIYRLGLELERGTPVPDLPGVGEWPQASESLRPPPALPPARPLVVGCGPAGLFAALRLAAYGLKPCLLERGAPVEERMRDVASYWRRGELNLESNVLFGEGGAGTFSDGKLTYRGRDPRKAWVFEVLVRAGAPAEILFDARPHLGTDRLRKLLRRIRRTLTASGCDILFHTRVEELVAEQSRVIGVLTRDARIPASAVFLAPGHSARDLLQRLVSGGVPAEPKGFAVGLRIEVPQNAIDGNQYGRWAGAPELPPAEFNVKARAEGGRDVYSFCMCPGGVVIPAGTESDGLVVNGMSASGRRGRWANAALVVTVSPKDCGATPLAGFRFQRDWERRAAYCAGRGRVPAQRVSDFLADRPSAGLPQSSCPWGLIPADLARCLPTFATRALRVALPHIFRQMGPLERGVLIGVETRTSSPLRVVRGETLESPGCRGLYPIGEGAGQAGGIVSAAIDGARAADAYARSLGGGLEVSDRGPDP
jgi:uncharacterized FAD-dependent dehydrogenase